MVLVTIGGYHLVDSLVVLTPLKHARRSCGAQGNRSQSCGAPYPTTKRMLLIPLNVQLDSKLICYLVSLMNNDKGLKQSINFSAVEIRYPFIKDIGF